MIKCLFITFHYMMIGPLKGSDKKNSGIQTKKGGMGSESANMVVDMDMSDEDLDDICRGLL